MMIPCSHCEVHIVASTQMTIRSLSTMDSKRGSSMKQENAPRHRGILLVRGSAQEIAPSELGPSPQTHHQSHTGNDMTV